MNLINISGAALFPSITKSVKLPEIISKLAIVVFRHCPNFLRIFSYQKIAEKIVEPSKINCNVRYDLRDKPREEQ